MAVNIHSKIYSVIKKEGKPTSWNEQAVHCKKLDLKKLPFSYALMDKKERKSARNQYNFGICTFGSIFSGLQKDYTMSKTNIRLAELRKFAFSRCLLGSGVDGAGWVLRLIV
jgi:hypothetical protein